MRSTFAGFNVAKGGIDAARANLNITGQNMTNAGVSGYTRQRVDLYSIGTGYGSMRYAQAGPHIGQGVMIGGTSQIRDPYLDVRYRRESSKLGDTSTQASTLHDLEYVFDEIAKDGVSTQLQDLIKQLQNLSTNAGDPVAENIVKTSSQMLMKIFRSCASQIDNIKSKELEYFEGAVKDVNNLMSEIADINLKIKDAHIAGMPALELQDTRNSMIDALSGYLPIETTTKLIDIGSGTMVEEISISMTSDNGDRFNLVDHDEFRKFDIVRDAQQNVVQPVKLQLFGSDGKPVGGSDKAFITLENGLITDEITSGALAGHLKMLNTKGEFDMPTGTKQRGIQYYENMLDELVGKFADVFNQANSTNEGPNWDKPMFDAINAKPKIDTSSIPGLEGYVINVNASKSPSEVIPGEMVINLNLPANATNADLEKAIKDLVTANSGVGDAFDGVTAADISKISVDGNELDGTSFGSNMSKPKITAGNIGISEKWQNTSGSYITASKPELSTGDVDKDKGNNIQFMISLLSKEFEYTAPGSNVPLFKGSFEGMFTNISTTLGIESKDIKRQDDSFAIVLNDIQSQRSSISSVNIDEEAINLIQFQHSLTASSRFMTTLDEAVDTIINRMGVVGR